MGERMVARYLGVHGSRVAGIWWYYSNCSFHIFKLWPGTIYFDSVKAYGSYNPPLSNTIKN